MRRIGLAVVLVLSSFLASLVVRAQPPTKVYRLGILTVSRSWAFEEELRKFGYVEGGNLAIMRRYTQGSLEAVYRLAKEIVDFRPDVVLVANGEMAAAVLRARNSVPVVVAAASDLLAQGYVISLAKPGGNVTGLQIMSGDLVGKRMELLREMAPGLARLAIIVPSNPGGFAVQRRETEQAARTLGIQIETLWVVERNQLIDAFKQISRRRHDGVMVYSHPFTYSERSEIARLAAASGVPAIYETREFVDAGGLVSYGPNIGVLYRRAASYVDRILKGAKPGDLPIEQPTKFELVINLKTAKAIGLTIPQSVLGRADRVIE
jgi:putative ABC transport system substrate-binding protein